MSKYGVISGPYFPVFSPNAGKYGPEITPYLDTFLAMAVFKNLVETLRPGGLSIENEESFVNVLTICRKKHQSSNKES